MDVARPYRAVCPTVEGDVLHVLARTTMGMTGRQIALLTGRSSHSGVLKALNRLTEHGLVDRVELNRAFLYSLNRDHLAYPAVVALDSIRMDLLDRLRAELRAWPVAAVHAALFGSAARADGDTGSDIDLLVVRPGAVTADDERWRQQIGQLERKVLRWTGNRAAVVEKTKDEIEMLVEGGRAIVVELQEDGIALAGPPINAIAEKS